MITAIQHIRILDGLGGRLEQGTLMIDNTRILAAGPERAVRIPKGTRRIDGRGLTVLPDSSTAMFTSAWAPKPMWWRRSKENLPPSRYSKPLNRPPSHTAGRIYHCARRGVSRPCRLCAEACHCRRADAGPRILAAGLAICMPGTRTLHRSRSRRRGNRPAPPCKINSMPERK